MAQSGKSKAPDPRPARKKYWAGRHLESNKIKKMRKAYGLTKEQAVNRWHDERQGRAKMSLHPTSDRRHSTHRLEELKQ